MTLISHSTEGSVVERLIPLLQDILVNNTKHQQSESRISSRMPQEDVSLTPFDVSLVFRFFIKEFSFYYFKFFTQASLNLGIKISYSYLQRSTMEITHTTIAIR